MLTETIIVAIISALGAITGAFLGAYFTRKSTSELIKANQEEAKRQREFEEFQSKQKFIIQRKIEAYELAIRVLHEFPNLDKGQNSRAVISLLKLYLPTPMHYLISNFDIDQSSVLEWKCLIGLHGIYDDLAKSKWDNAYGVLLNYLKQEINELQGNL